MLVNSICSSGSIISMKGNLAKISNIVDHGHISEDKFDELVRTLPVDKEGKIVRDELDSEDREIFDKIAVVFNKYYGEFKGTVKNLKKSFTYRMTKTATEQYNGRTATVKRHMQDGSIISVNTGAKTLEEAKEHMGLNRVIYVDNIYSPDYNASKIPVYGKRSIIKRGDKEFFRSDYFRWVEAEKTMYHTHTFESESMTYMLGL